MLLVGALNDEDKPGLLDEQQALKNAQATWGGTLGVVSAAGFAVNPALAAVPLAIGAISIAVLRRKQNAVERILADPPRFDYETGTRARRRRYAEGTLGDDNLALATDQAAIATLRATAYLEASVRADERSQGARIAGRGDLVDWHLEEARHLFELGRRWSGEMATALDVLAIAWAAFAVDSDLDETPLPPDVEVQSLPPRAREALARTGMVVVDLDLSIGRPAEADAALAPGHSTLGDVALDSATATRALASSAGRVSSGRRALPRRAFEERAPSLSMSERRQAIEARERGELDEAQRYLLPPAERGSVDAMFDLGLIAHQRGDRRAAGEWLDRAAALSTPPPRIEYMKKIDEWPEELHLPQPPREIEE